MKVQSEISRVQAVNLLEVIEIKHGRLTIENPLIFTEF